MNSPEGFPNTLAEKQIAEILKREGVVNDSISTPVYNPRFLDERVKIWRERLFPVGAVLGAVGFNLFIGVYSPGVYNWGNTYNIGAASLGAVILGVIIAEGGVHYLADRDDH